MIDYYSSQLQSLAEHGNLRHVPEESPTYGIIDLSTNDYLGLGANQAIREEFYDTIAVRDIPMSSTASRLLSSSQKYYTALEKRLEELYGRSILLFNSGYHANTGLISALASAPSTIIVADKLVHASIIDGIMLSKSPFTRFPHNDFDRLEAILEKNSGKFSNFIVAVESVYSMDGDRADIERLIDIKRRFPEVILYVDEAHAVGVEGPGGLGLAAATHDGENIDVIVGTFGKAFASMGAFCAVSPMIKTFLINRARSFIFSTAFPPVTAAWTLFILNKIVGMDTERAHLADLSRKLSDGINSLFPHLCVKPSHIIPVITGDPVSAIEKSALLFESGFKVLPIRVPTVPPGTDRLRVSLSAALSADVIDSFILALRNT